MCAFGSVVGIESKKKNRLDVKICTNQMSDRQTLCLPQASAKIEKKSNKFISK